jgi:hypothetical protein
MDVALRKWVPMSAAAKNKKPLLTGLFNNLTRGSFFENDKIDMDEFFKRIPKELWDSVFTLGETKAMVEAQEKRLGKGLMLRVMKVSTEWRGIGGSPLKSPTSMEEIGEAKSKKSSQARIAWVQALLAEQNPRSDGWLKYIYEDLIDLLVLEPLLDPANEYRVWMAKKLARGASRRFETTILEIVKGSLPTKISDETINARINDFVRLKSGL